MAKYLILIYGDEQAWDAATPERQQRTDDGHAAFGAKAGTAVLSAAELESSSTATTLRGSSVAAPTVTDGPFLETKEGLGGFYLLEAADLDEAISLAALLPEVAEDHCAVEIRPVVQRD
jgi:hypothetical protein